MIEPLTSLAFSVYSGKGVYALLLGSGLSRAAQIPTGWEVTLDLIKKIAAVEGEDCGAAPERWYLGKFGKEPDYSDLLGGLALTPAERANALAAYFEATPREREDGMKVPTAAHNAIAQMVGKGYFRVIVTTNFDRLMEQSLEAEGINPTVISTSDMVKGAVPLTHSRCTVIKVHGDYRDVRLRNTFEELATYDSDMNKLLDQIFDEYGLIVCGWSATWDKALRDAILRCPNRRYSVNWATRGALSPEADLVAKFRQASLLPIESADEFFTSLADKLIALERFNAPHPLSTAIAVASLKRFLVEDRFRIELNDLVMDETERRYDELSKFGNPMRQAANLDFKEYMYRYEESMETLIALVANGCYYGRPAQAPLWGRVISRCMELAATPLGSNPIGNLRRYPACMLFYVGGIACVSSGNYETMKHFVKDLRTTVDKYKDGKDDFVARKVTVAHVLDASELKQALNSSSNFLPGEHLFELLREPLRPFLPNDSQYEQALDRFEYLLSLINLDELMRDGGRLWPSIGLYAKKLYSSFGSSELISLK